MQNKLIFSGAKRLVAISLISSFVLSGCYTINYGGKKPLFMVDAPADLKVSKDGKDLEIGSYNAFTTTSRSGNVETRTHHNYPGVLFKFKSKNNLQLTSKGKSVKHAVKGKAGVGLLIIELIFTFGIGTIVDCATGSFFYPKDRFVDVPALLDGKNPRTQKELRKYIQSLNFTQTN